MKNISLSSSANGLYKGRCFICNRLVTSEQGALRAVVLYSDGLHDILVLLIMYQLVHKRTPFPAPVPIKYPSPCCTRYFREVLVDLVREKWTIIVSLPPSPDPSMLFQKSTKELF